MLVTFCIPKNGSSCAAVCRKMSDHIVNLKLQNWFKSQVLTECVGINNLSCRNSLTSITETGTILCKKIFIFLILYKVGW